MKEKRLILAGIVLSLAVMLFCCLMLYLGHSGQEIGSYPATVIPFS